MPPRDFNNKQENLDDDNGKRRDSKTGKIMSMPTNPSRMQPAQPWPRISRKSSSQFKNTDVYFRRRTTHTRSHFNSPMRRNSPFPPSPTPLQHTRLLPPFLSSANAQLRTPHLAQACISARARSAMDGGVLLQRPYVRIFILLSLSSVVHSHAT